LNRNTQPRSQWIRLLQWLAHPQHFLLLLLSLQPIIWLVIFVERYASPLPIWEEWTVKGLPAYLLKTGGFTFDALIQQHFEHRLLLTRALTLVNTALFNWDMKLEIYANLLLAGGVLLLCLYCLYRDQPRLVRYGLLVLPFLIFTSRALNVWLWGMYSQHLFANLLILGVITWVWVRPATLRTLLIAAGFILLAQFTNGNGLLGWGLILLLMPVVGYRQRWVYGLWVLLAFISVLLYFNGFDSRVQPQITAAAIPAGLAFLGTVFAGGPEPLLIITGGGGLLFAAVNAAYLYRGRVRTLRQMIPWLLFCLFGIATAGLLASGRAITLTGYTLYVASMTGFWIGLTGLTIMTVDDLWHRQRKGWQNGLYAANLTGIALIVSLYGFVAMDTAKAARVPASEEACAIALPLTRDLDCTLPNMQHGILELMAGSIDYIASADLLVFPQVTVLETDTAQTENPLLVLDMPLGWQHIYAMQHLRGQIATYDSDHLIEGDDPPVARLDPYNNTWIRIQQNPDKLMAAPLPDDLLADRLPRYVRDDSPEHLTAFDERLVAYDAVWWVRVNSDFGDGSFPIERTSYGDAYLEQVRAQGFLPFDVPAFYSDMPDALDVRYYRRPPLLPPVRYQFGDAPYQLESWALSSYSLSCDAPLTVESWWSIGTDHAPQPVSLQLVLVGGDGTAIAETEDLLATTEALRDWGQQTRISSSQLAIGCDAPTGSYDLIAQLLNPADGTRQAIQDANGTSFNTAYLTSVTLE